VKEEANDCILDANTQSQLPATQVISNTCVPQANHTVGKEATETITQDQNLETINNFTRAFE
jgi:hypothetical protein